MGVVYEAIDHHVGTRVALKALKAQSADELLRFKAEFRSLQDIGHPNLVRLGELFNEEGEWFFSMELIEGVDLRRWVRGDSGPRDDQRLRSALAGLADGLEALHAAGKIHRDIKPSNVLVTEAGRVVLLDFGLVTEVTRARELSDAHMVGTADYVSPEQAASQPVGPATDWYSVGVVLFELLSGQLPFQGRPLRILMDKQVQDPPALRDLDPNIPEDLAELCRDLMRRDPNARAGAADMERVLRGGSPQRPSVTASSRASHAFVGRAEDLAALHEAFESTASGEPVAVMVQGASGVGKSALVRRFVDTLSRGERVCTVLFGRCYERESVPYRAIDGVIDALSRVLGKLPRSEVKALLPEDAAILTQIFPVLARVDGIARARRLGAAPQEPRELRRRGFAALRELLVALAGQAPLCLVIDDFQWADADSLVLLNELLYPPDAPPLCLIATTRVIGEPPELPCSVRSIDVTGLTVELATELTRGLLTHAGLAESRAEAIVRESSGHPLFIHELIRYLETAGDEGDVAVRLDEALWHRIELLESPARRVLELVAVAGTPLRQEVAARAADMEYVEFQRWAAMLRVGHLVLTEGVRGSDRIEAYHNRVREAIWSKLGGDQLQSLHHRLATALESSDAAALEPQRLVWHFDCSGEPTRAAERAVEAARIAEGMVAFQLAADLYRTALRLGRYDVERERELRICLADALVAAGRGTEAADEYMVAADGADPATRLECQRRAASQLLLSGYIERGLETLRGVLRDVEIQLPSSHRRALLSAGWRRLRLRLRGFRWTPRHENEIAASTLKQLDVYRAVATSLAMVDTIRGADIQSRFVLLALDVGEPSRVVRAMGLESAFASVTSRGGIERARKLLARVERIAAERPDPLHDAWAAAIRGIIAYFAAELDESLATLTVSEALFREQTTATAWEQNTVRVFHLWALRHAGELVRLRRRLEENIRDARDRGDRYAETTMIRTCVRAWLCHDQVERARDELARTTWTPPRASFHLQHWYELKARSELELYTRAGEIGLAEAQEGFRAMAKSLLGRVQVVRTESGWVLGRLFLLDAVEGNEVAVRLRSAERAARSLVRERTAYGMVFGGLVGAAVCHQRGDDEGAVERLSRVMEVADASAMGLYSAGARWVCAGLLEGSRGEAMLEEARAYFDDQRVPRPERVVNVICPGFST